MKSEDLVLLLSTVGLLILIALPLIIILAAPAIWAERKAGERTEPPPTIRPDRRATSEEHRLARGEYRGADRYRGAGSGDGGASHATGSVSWSWSGGDSDAGGGDGGD